MQSTASGQIIGQLLCERCQLCEPSLDIRGTRVVFVNHLLKLLEEINPSPIEMNHSGELQRNCPTQLLCFGRLPAFVELRPERLKIDLAQVDVVGCCR